MVRNLRQPPLAHRYYPYHGAVEDGGRGPDEGDESHGVEVRELREDHRQAHEDEVPLDGCERPRDACRTARDLEEELHAPAADDDEGGARPGGEIHDRELGHALP